MSDPSVAVVTGGASGIGLALGHGLGARGAMVLIADRDEDALGAAVAELRAAGIAAEGHIVDVRDADSVQRLAQRAGELGPIRTLCANAGVSASGSPIWDTSEAELEFVLDVNLHGVVRCLRSFVPLLFEQEGSSNVVVTASMAGLVTMPTSGAYSASKAAAIAVAKALAVDLQAVRSDVRVALLCPGMVGTNLQRTSAAQQIEAGAGSPTNVEEYHSALNALGVTPRVVAGWVLDALDRGEFWVLPPADDPLSMMFQDELENLVPRPRGAR